MVKVNFIPLLIVILIMAVPVGWALIEGVSWVLRALK